MISISMEDELVKFELLLVVWIGTTECDFGLGWALALRKICEKRIHHKIANSMHRGAEG